MSLPWSALLFDLDGTLIDSRVAICESASEAFQLCGVEVSPAEIGKHLGASLEELFQGFAEGHEAAEFDFFVAQYIELHDAHPERHPDPMPGVREGVAELARLDLLMGVATTKPTQRARDQLVKVGLADYFQHIQGTDIGMQAKPAPDVILHACQALGVHAKNVIMIGDTFRDVGAAHAAESMSLQIHWGSEDFKREFMKPHSDAADFKIAVAWLLAHASP